MYVLGRRDDQYGQPVTMLWKKDGTPKRLTDGTTNVGAYTIRVNGASVIIEGDDLALGISVSKTISGAALAPAPGTTRTAHSALVSGEDVYVVGHEYDVHGRPTPRLWKNGAIEDLCGSNPNAVVNAVFVKGPVK